MTPIGGMFRRLTGRSDAPAGETRSSRAGANQSSTQRTDRTRTDQSRADQDRSGGGGTETDADGRPKRRRGRRGGRKQRERREAAARREAAEGSGEAVAAAPDRDSRSSDSRSSDSRSSDSRDGERSSGGRSRGGRSRGGRGRGGRSGESRAEGGNRDSRSDERRGDDGRKSEDRSGRGSGSSAGSNGGRGGRSRDGSQRSLPQGVRRRDWRARAPRDSLDPALPEDVAFRPASAGGDGTILPARRRPPPGPRTTQRVIVPDARYIVPEGEARTLNRDSETGPFRDWLSEEVSTAADADGASPDDDDSGFDPASSTGDADRYAEHDASSDASDEAFDEPDDEFLAEDDAAAASVDAEPETEPEADADEDRPRRRRGRRGGRKHRRPTEADAVVETDAVADEDALEDDSAVADVDDDDAEADTAESDAAAEERAAAHSPEIASAIDDEAPGEDDRISEDDRTADLRPAEDRTEAAPEQAAEEIEQAAPPAPPVPPARRGGWGRRASEVAAERAQAQAANDDADERGDEPASAIAEHRDSSDVPSERDAREDAAPDDDDALEDAATLEDAAAGSAPTAPPRRRAATVDPSRTFADLGVSAASLEWLNGVGFETPTPVQAEAIPVLLDRRDVVGVAQTGTGKTLAFGIPMVEALDASSPTVQSIVLVPTRELAQQVEDVLRDIGQSFGLSTVGLLGGRRLDDDFRALDQGPQVVVGTPGRVLDHLRRGTLSLRDVRYAVLDEADQMLDIGFMPDITRILSRTPRSRQTALFSATMPNSVKNIVWRFMDDPRTVEIAAEYRTVDTIDQVYYEVAQRDKIAGLRELVEHELRGRSLIFCNTKRAVDNLTDRLQGSGVSVGALHGDMDQRRRDRTVQRFREGDVDVLIATNVAARGLDIPEVTHVVNYDVPQNAEEYVHRIGRTGRAGREGRAITFVSEYDMKAFEAVQSEFGEQLRSETLALYGER